MKALALVLLIAVLSVPVRAPAQAATDNTETDTFDNGRFWRAMDLDQKLCWIRGYKDGIAAAILTVPGQKSEPYTTAAHLLLPSVLTFGEMASAVDRFYSDSPENAPVPIWEALRIVTLKANGAAPEDIERATSSFRAASAK